MQCVSRGEVVVMRVLYMNSVKATQAVVLGVVLLGRIASGFEVDTMDTTSSATYDALFQLIQVSAQLAQLEEEKAKKIERVDSSQKVNSNFGSSALPAAKIATEDFSKKALQVQKLGDLGGTPFGATSGKSTFGKTDSDSSFKSLTAERNPIAIEPYYDEPNLYAENPEEMNLEQMVEFDRKWNDLEKEMSKLAQKETPFENGDYKAYEKAKTLFQKNDKLIARLDEVDEKFTQNAKELFVKHSWRDMDKVGKRPFERFIERQEAKEVFPYPKGQEPKPEIHRGEKSH